MADRTGIEWTDATWNPIVGCSIVSPGCTNCYAMTMAARIQRMSAGAGQRSHYAGTTRSSNAGPVWSGRLVTAPSHILTQPLRWQRPRRIFVNSMGDLFHENVPDAEIDRVFAVMNSADWHTYQVLTKRSPRMRAYLTAPDLAERIADAQHDMGHEMHADGVAAHIWLGISAERQAEWDVRVLDLRATPAAVRFVSAEPLLGPIVGDMAGIDQVIVGGESGPSARPMHPDWARGLRDQCAAAGTAFFFKQWGSFEPAVDRERDDPDWRFDYGHRFGDRGDTRWLNLAGGCGFHGERFHVMRRVGKRAAGRLLDGVDHNGMPEARP